MIDNIVLIMALRLLKGVRELRFVLCQSSSSSEPLRYACSHSRKYIASNYDAIRESPARITVRECENASPIAIATFNYGVEKTVELRKMGASEIEEAIKELESYSQHLSKTIKI